MLKDISAIARNFKSNYNSFLVQVAERTWQRRMFHFDNVFQAYMSLFVVMTFEGWPG